MRWSSIFNGYTGPLTYYVLHHYHSLCSSSSTVVVMTNKVIGKIKILKPSRCKTPKNIETKLGVNDYVNDPTILLIFVEIGPTRSVAHYAEI